MIRNASLILGTLAALAALPAMSNSAYAEDGFPQLFFNYSNLYDDVCTGGNSKEIDPVWAEEAEHRTAEFATLWEKNGPSLLNQLLDDFQKGFSRKEITATLSVCPQSSISNPLVINVKPYLKTFMPQYPSWPDHAFVDAVFHELIHNWLDENLAWPTPLIKKYKNEPPVVLNHLHLMAIQRLVYDEQKRDDLQQWIADLYSKDEDDYGRAWQIVEKEGPAAFIAELKK